MKFEISEEWCLRMAKLEEEAGGFPGVTGNPMKFHKWADIKREKTNKDELDSLEDTIKAMDIHRPSDDAQESREEIDSEHNKGYNK